MTTTSTQPTYFVQRGATFWPESNLNSTIFDKLPGGNYTVGCTPEGRFFLEKAEDFRNNTKIYGKTPKQAERIISTFFARSKNLGVLLEGEKGSGKSLLLRLLCERLATEHSVPNLIITQPLCGEGFFKFLASINQECVISLDEFEKVYDEDAQEVMLTLLDGVFPSKKLFILTCNDHYRLNSHMRNRPGRIHYMISYKGLDMDFIREYCQDRLDDKSRIDEVANISSMFSAMNFDMLQAIVWEVNTYKEPVAEAMQMLNARPGEDDGYVYDVSVQLPGSDKVFSGDELNRRTHLHSPLKLTTWKIEVGLKSGENPAFASAKTLLGRKKFDVPTLNYATTEDATMALDSDNSFESSISVTIRIGDLFRVGPEIGTFVFRNKEGQTVTFTRKVTEEFDMSRMNSHLL